MTVAIKPRIESDHKCSLKPILKWAGGKRWLVDEIKKLWGTDSGNKVLIEPFCGGLSIVLGLRPEKALLNDINPHLINLYRFLKNGLEIDCEMKNEKDFYYQRREEFNSLIKSGEINTKRCASLFYYLNRTGFNGLCRFNSKGLFNVPFGRYKQINYKRNFLEYRYLLRNWSFYNLDFSHIALDESDFIYADPPYDVEFRQYSKDGFEWEDQVRLAEWLSHHSGTVVASNQATPRILELYKDLKFSVEIVDAPRRISCNGDRSPAKEIIAIKQGN